MPTSITHQLLAEETYNALPIDLRRNIRSLSHYYLGAQGADVCFTYRPLHAIYRHRQNLGSFIHAEQQLLFFQLLHEHAKGDPRVFDYAMGYLTHYAADTVFHPVIYRRLHRLDLSARAMSLYHHSIEHAYDGVLLRALRHERLTGYRLPDMPGITTTSALRGIYRFYREFGGRSGWGEIDEDSFVKAVKHYLKLVSVRLPIYRKRRAERAEELFFSAKECALKLMDAFTDKNGVTVHSGLFDMHYLTGMPTSLPNSKNF